MRCVVTGQTYTIFGYKGKQVRENIHSCDLVSAFMHFDQNPRVGEVYNMSGRRHAKCSILEALALCNTIVGKKADRDYAQTNRSGDYVRWIGDVRKVQAH